MNRTKYSRLFFWRRWRRPAVRKLVAMIKAGRLQSVIARTEERKSRDA